MASKTIIHREKTAEALRGALVAHGREAAEELARALEPEASPDVGMPEMEDFQILLRRRLETARRRLVAADEGHLAVLRRLEALRRSRDAAVGEVRRLLARLRNAVEGVYGPGSSPDLLLLEGPTPRDPVVLQRTASRVAEHLEGHGLPRPEDALVGVELAPHLWVEALRGPLERLGDHLRAITLEQRDAVDALLAKNHAKKDYDRLYSSTTRMLQEFFRYVGMDAMATTIRPKRRKASTTEGERPEDPADEREPGVAQASLQEARDPQATRGSQEARDPQETMEEGATSLGSTKVPAAISAANRRWLAPLPAPRSRDPASQPLPTT